MKISLPFVGVFYGVMALMAWALAEVWLGLDVWQYTARAEAVATWHPLTGLGAGALVGVASVASSQLLDRFTTWAKRLGEAFKEMLGPLGPWQIFVIAASSSLGEEMLFRGFLQQALAERLFGGGDLALLASVIISSLLFGGMHIGPERRTFLPWTIMAVVMGAVFALLFWWTGDLVAPITAHFTINFLNLSLMQERDAS